MKVVFKSENSDELPLVNIPKLIDHSQEHLDLEDILDKIENRQEALKIILSKISYDGIIELSGLDLLAVAEMLHYACIDVNNVNELLYKNKSVSCMEDMVLLLQNNNFSILLKSFSSSGLNYYVKAKRTC